MLCEKCGKNIANVKIVKNVNGYVTEQHLCSSCAASEENHSFNSYSNSLFDNLFNFFTPITGTSLICPTCHTEYETFKNTGLLGCPDCYESFESLIEPIFRNVHGATRHIGKNPGRKVELKEDKQDEKSILQAKLDEAVKAENYEEAAVLRDKIKALDNGGKNE